MTTSTTTITFETALGRCGVRWSEAGITGVLLPGSRSLDGPSVDAADVPPFVRRAIDGIAENPLCVDGAAFARGHVATQEAGGNLLFARRAGHEVARELLGGEAVERHIVVEGANDPVAVAV